MKLKNLILPAISMALLGSCSMFHDDLPQCRQKVTVRLNYTRNVDGTDKFDEQVHCAKVLLYDGDGVFIDQYDYDSTEGLSVTLPAGNYHAVAYGGMGCDRADFLFSNPLEEGHNYTSLETYLSGTRAAESAKDLHDHFHAMGDFMVKNTDVGEVSATFDMTKNTNRFRVEISYNDGMPVGTGDFSCVMTADNGVTDHKNDIVAQGEAITYRAHSEGTGTTENASGDMVPGIWEEFTTGRLTNDMDVHLRIVPSWGSNTIDLPLIDYLDEIRRKDLGDMSLQDYLDRQDRWTIKITVEPNNHLAVVVSVKINDWKVVVNGYDF